MILESVMISEDGVDYHVICETITYTICRTNESHLERFGVTKWIADGNTPSPWVGPDATAVWLEKVRQNDNILPRWGEDILDGMADKSDVAQITLDRLQAKKDLRATKP